ncbi:YheC/YheD family protein [Alteribacter populi]|uniref:YheC/YheD family endospore coat-associated protein n=1 Tax=Alteribacter populi TaxID=2011011 RepID=UPI0012FDFE19|nr:YheC/YheD family protein [Alteribacter populi]
MTIVPQNPLTLIRHFKFNERMSTNQIVISTKDNPLSESEALTISLGSWIKQCVLVRDEQVTPDTIVVHPKLFSSASLLKIDYSLQLVDQKRTHWRFGPVIAMLVSDAQENEAAPFGLMTEFATELATYAKSTNALFFVIPLSFDLEEERVTGFILENSSWKVKQLPYPDVVYNRLSSPKKETSKKGKHFLNQLRAKSIPFFNDRFIHKWEMHQLLDEHEELRPYLPKTILGHDRESFNQITKQFPQLYLKPIWGREGNGIIRVTVHEHSLEAEYPSDTSIKSYHFNSFHHLFKTILPRFKEKQYLVQQSIPLLQLDGCLIDIRVLTTKNETGEWRVASKIARCGVKDQIVSNVAKGGSQRKLLEVLNELIPEPEASQLFRFMNELAIEIARTIEEELGDQGHFGEFGVDIGIDTNGHPWILEVNSKPSKTYENTESEITIRPSAKKLLAFCQYLSGFE